MTPKEKCNELIVKIMSIELADDRIPKITFNQAKQCALIAVDEIINSQWQFGIISLYGAPFNHYWQEVKQEIEKL